MEIPRHWRLKEQRYRLAGSTCPACGQPAFPPRPVCPHCRSKVVPNADERLTLLVSSVAIAALESHIRPAVTESMPG